MRRKTILVTGSSGFIGSALCEKLILLGLEVIPYDLKIGRDVLNKAQIKEFLSGVDTVIHLASPSSSLMFYKSPEKCMRTALEGLRNVLNDWSGHLIFPSTCTIYGNSKNPVTEKKSLPFFPNRYAESKVRSEELCLSATTNGTRVTILRIFSGFGPGEAHKGEYASPVYKFINNLVQNKEIIVYGTGRQVRDFIYIDDITSAIIKSIEYAGHEKIFNIGSGIATTFGDLITFSTQILLKKAICRYVNPPDGYVPSIVADINLANKELSFSPTITLNKALKIMARNAVRSNKAI